MATLSANISEAHYSIKKWLGVNETPDGDAGLQGGEAAVMRNFRITDGGALKKRPGSKRTIGLTTNYHVEIGAKEESFMSTSDYLAERFDLYPTAAADADGNVELTGTPAQANYEDAGNYAGYYYRASDGSVYALTRTEVKPQPEGSTAVEGGYINIGKDYEETGFLWQGSPQTYSTIKIVNGTFSLSDGKHSFEKGRYFRTDGPYYMSSGRIYGSGYFTMDGDEIYALYGYPVTIAQVDSHEWFGYPVTAEANEAEDIEIRALWSGRVGAEDVFVAACSSHLWKLEETDGVWSKSDIGSIDTSGPVGIFGYGGKLYILDGEEYRVWDGKSLLTVAGYIPCVVSASAPGGGGQQLEQINKLTLKRRQKFSSDGSSTVYHLAETQLASVDKVAIDGLPNTAFSADVTAGTVTFNSAPASGQNNVEIWYTASLSKVNNYNGDGSTRDFALPGSEEDIEILSVTVAGSEVTDYTINGQTIHFTTPPANAANVVINTTLKDPRKTVTNKRYYEFFNGSNDNRVFLYGDGSSEAIYSGIREDTGKATAEYFPDLNEMEIGNDNTPITAMRRHYNRLLVFKSSSTYSVYYDALTLADGTVTAGFYVSAVNRDIGNIAYGQALLVENRLRTLDGNSIYEWRGTNTSGNITNDQRNAQRISQKVEHSIRGFDLANAVCFYDKLEHEYYCVSGGNAVVQNVDNGAWYVYTDFPAVRMASHNDELYYGTADGWLVHVSERYFSDNGTTIDAYWESGSLSFDRNYKRKYSPKLWVSLASADGAGITVGMLDDNGDADEGDVVSESLGIATAKCMRLKARKFSYYKLTFASKSTAEAAVVEALTISVKYTTDVKRR